MDTFTGTSGRHACVRAIVGFLALLTVALVPLLGAATTAHAHGFSSVVYADVSSSPNTPQTVTVRLSLEYDLMLFSVALAQNDDAFHRQGQPFWDDGNYGGMANVVQQHLGSVSKYVFRRFTVAVEGNEQCPGELGKAVTVDTRDDVPYAEMTAVFTCPARGIAEPGHEITSTLFPDSEQFVTGTRTIVTYHIDGRSGSATLDANQQTFSTQQAWYERFWQFFRLGAEHLLSGLDHILFLIALIVGSRRLREVVLSATAFTVAHSVTFILAALGVVSPPSVFVESTIALSIAAVAGWYLLRLVRGGAHADELVVESQNVLALDRAGWTRIAVVFVFGLIHGLGFAGALGIQEAFSWTLLWSLLIFNIGIEVVQLGLIAVVFPLLVWLRRHARRASLWVSAIVSAGVMIMGLIWFIERIFGLGD